MKRSAITATIVTGVPRRYEPELFEFGCQHYGADCFDLIQIPGIEDSLIKKHVPPELERHTLEWHFGMLDALENRVKVSRYRGSKVCVLLANFSYLQDQEHFKNCLQYMEMEQEGIEAITHFEKYEFAVLTPDARIQIIDQERLTFGRPLLR